MRAVRSLPPSLFFPLALGCAWGLGESLAGLLLRLSPLQPVTGSLLTGFAAVFLAAGWSMRPAGYAGAILPLPAIAAIVVTAGLRGASCTSAPVVNPVVALALEAGVFLALASVGALHTRSVRAQAFIGGAAALGAALLFPAVVMLTGARACTLPDSGIPVAVAGAPLAALAGCFSTPAGVRLGRALAAFHTSHPGGEHLRPGWLAGGLCLQVILLAAAA